MNEVELRTNEGLGKTTHFWCAVCRSVQPTFFEGFDMVDTSNNFRGGDVVCKECCYVIATGYALKGDE